MPWTAWKLLFLISIISITGSACVSHQNMISLNKGDIISEFGQLDSASQFKITPRIQPYRINLNDQLLIRINAYDGSMSDYISGELSNEAGGSRLNFDPQTLYFNSYSVDNSGSIKLPVIGKISVRGMTTNQLQDSLDVLYKPYFRLASSKVKLGNNRVTLLGEFTEPGVHYLYNDQNTLLEAIGLGGDITSFGNRKKVKLIRQTSYGVKSTYINLNRSQFLSSPYYYVQPNDVIYVEPLKAKSFDESARSVGIVISSLSLAVIIANIFIN